MSAQIQVGDNIVKTIDNPNEIAAIQSFINNQRTGWHNGEGIPKVLVLLWGKKGLLDSFGLGGVREQYSFIRVTATKPTTDQEADAFLQMLSLTPAQLKAQGL